MFAALNTIATDALAGITTLLSGSFGTIIVFFLTIGLLGGALAVFRKYKS